VKVKSRTSQKRDDVVVFKEDRTASYGQSLQYEKTTGLSNHISIMASIEALYIFDEHKYVSSLAIGLHAQAHLSDYVTATSSSTMSIPADHLHPRHCSRSTSNNLRRALA
jgi:hypothetical protein